MLNSLSLSAVSAGLLSAFVGFASSFAIIISGLTAVGASLAEASWRGCSGIWVLVHTSKMRD